MNTVTIKIEQMYPNRKLIEQIKWNDMGRTIQQMTVDVERHIKLQMNVYRHKFPEMTELRWEFTDIGQGHYIMISDQPLNVFVGRLSYEQLTDVLKKAIDVRDWQMAENVCYQLKLMGEISIESFADFELPYAVYEFDWMFDNDKDIDDELLDSDGPTDYAILQVAVNNKEVGFESNSQWITNPFYDETLRFPVDPIQYYGREKLAEWL